jgi:alkyl hydroperoxide reductase subunit F
MDLNLNLGGLGFSDKKSDFDTDKIYDLVIIGGGPAGLNAALYGIRKGMDTIIVTDRLGGQVLDTTSVENYLGYEKETGEGLIEKFKKHVEGLDVKVIKNMKVLGIDKKEKVKKVNLEDGSTLKTKTIIIASGSKPRKLGVPGEEQFLNKGVAYCAICDGPLFQGLDVAVAGGGNSAVEAAIDLAKICNKVWIVHRSKFRADKIILDRLEEISNIEVLLETKIKSIHGEKLISSINIENKSGEKNLKIDGLFVEIGYLPNSDFIKNLVDLNDRGEILIDKSNKTSEEGIFAAGDVTDVQFKQIVISAGDGAKAALSANEYINKNFD